MTSNKTADRRAYDVRLATRVEAQLAALPADVQRQLVRRLRGLALNPRPPAAEKLRGADLWRIKVSDYRAIYQIREHLLLVLVVKIGHRRDVYRSR